MYALVLYNEEEHYLSWDFFPSLNADTNRLDGCEGLAFQLIINIASA